jgi:DHA3 family multidrug efflux protein-like MFS transporter
MKPFYHLLGNALIAGITTNVVWFSATYWSYLTTKSVIATSVMAGVYLVCTALSGFWFGSIVDHNRKKKAMLISLFATLAFFFMGGVIYATKLHSTAVTVGDPWFWIFVSTLLFGVLAANIRTIALSTATTILIPEDKRDRYNGLSGTAMGITFMVANIVSGFALGFAGMLWILAAALALMIGAIVHLAFIPIPEKEIVHTDEQPKKIDIRGTIAVIKTIPGLFALIFFTTFNNFLGGVFMPLMDAYGLSLVPIHVWGTLWGFLSLGFIFGGLYIAKKGLGKQPLKTLFRINLTLWTICMVIAIQPSIVLLAVCMLFWISLVPFVEATEQTIIQKVVPTERQGRVFGFAQSIEQAASPITAFFIGPLAEYVFIPFMTTGKGVELIGSWYGVGPGRGIGLVFTCAGVFGFIVTLIAMRSRSYKLLARKYESGLVVDQTNGAVSN